MSEIEIDTPKPNIYVIRRNKLVSIGQFLITALIGVTFLTQTSSTSTLALFLFYGFGIATVLYSIKYLRNIFQRTILELDIQKGYVRFQKGQIMINEIQEFEIQNKKMLDSNACTVFLTLKSGERMKILKSSSFNLKSIKKVFSTVSVSTKVSLKITGSTW
ncbi:MAG: hypothetical protein COW03_18195 [Cytophagales bacterium CG12_big_fil_rev_8_21_14_0_65_40_12]|nr:MAG: hypothetical protein COW03_18195 [Cytophagales bacterium CG12_big_fil_rev_8_21_14_0_65_40_12]PIW04748.1 MAG: hypothetical protein COW40_07725 [Cytophagales bacterium CG17_big_fil_post_rev_8_21_14_2_50_40_13]